MFERNSQVNNLSCSLRVVRFVLRAQWQESGGEQNGVLVPVFQQPRPNRRVWILSSLLEIKSKFQFFFQ